MSKGPPPAYPATEAPPVYDPPPPYPGSPEGKVKVQSKSDSDFCCDFCYHDYDLWFYPGSPEGKVKV